MLPQNNLKPLTCNQVVHLYPDGEIRYKWSLHHRERDNDAATTNIIHAVPSKKTPRASPTLADRIRPGWGKLAKSKNFTGYAKNTIRRVAGALQLEFGKNKLAFCTLTIPGSAEIIIETVAKYSGYIMNRIQTWLSDNYQHSNGKKYVLGAVELQKRGMLHWHFLVAMEDELLIDKFRKDVEVFWYRVLKQVSEKTGIDLFKRRKGDSWKNRYEEIKHRAVDVQPVYKDAAAYLSKYMSKGCKKAKNKKQSIYYAPSRWWSCSRDATAVMHSRTIVYQLPTVSLETIKNDIIPFIEESFNAYEMWQVKLVNNYRKEQIGVIGRTNFKTCSEWVEDIIPVLVKGWEKYQNQYLEWRKQHHQKMMKAVKEREELESEYWAWVALQDFHRKSYEKYKNPVKHHKKYWEAIDNGEAIDSAWFKANGYTPTNRKQFNPDNCTLINRWLTG